MNKCFFCGKEIDTSKNHIPATWFGKYFGTVMVAVACPDCLKDKKNDKEWRKEHKVV